MSTSDPLAQRRGVKGVVVGACLALLVLGWAWRQGGRPAPTGLEPGEEAAERAMPRTVRARDVRSWLSAPRPVPGSAAGGEAGSGADSASASKTVLERVVAILLAGEAGDAEGFELPREALDRWVESGRTNAADLLAARQAGGGVEFLRRALEAFPNDPRVLVQASRLDDPADVRRERLDRLKAVAPDNALADYLSAKDHLKAGRVEEALADLRQAAGKRGFDDYSMEAALNGEELYLQSGRSAVEAKALGTSTVLLPHLAELKDLAADMGALEQRYLANGDRASAEAVARIGVQLGERLSTGERPRLLMHDIIGTAIERAVLRGLPPESTPDFLGTGVQQYAQEQAARREELNALGRGFAEWLPTASEPDVISFFDRMKAQGELAALKWIRERSGKKP